MKNLKQTKENKYSELLGLDEKFNKKFYSLKFNDPIIENEFILLIRNNYFYLKNFIHFFYLYLMILRISMSKVNNLNYLQITFLCGVILYFLLNIIYLVIQEIKLKKILDTMVSSMIIFLNTFNLIVLNFFVRGNAYVIQMRSIYILIICSFLDILLSIDYNFFLFITFFMINLILCLAVAIIKNDEDLLFIEFTVSFTFLLVAILFKKDISTLLRENFIQNYKFKRYFSYCNDLIDNMNGYLFTIKNKNILVYNENFKKHLSNIQKKLISKTNKINESTDIKEDIKIENEFLNNKKKNSSLKNNKTKSKFYNDFSKNTNLNKIYLNNSMSYFKIKNCIKNINNEKLNFPFCFDCDLKYNRTKYNKNKYSSSSTKYIFNEGMDFSKSTEKKDFKFKNKIKNDYILSHKSILNVYFKDDADKSFKNDKISNKDNNDLLNNNIKNKEENNIRSFTFPNLMNSKKKINISKNESLNKSFKTNKIKKFYKYKNDFDVSFKKIKKFSIPKLTNKILESSQIENFDNEENNYPNYIKEYMSNLFTLKLENQFTNLFEDTLTKMSEQICGNFDKYEY